MMIEAWSDNRRVLDCPVNDTEYYVLLGSLVDDEAGKATPIDPDVWARSFPALAPFLVRVAEEADWEETLGSISDGPAQAVVEGPGAQQGSSLPYGQTQANLSYCFLQKSCHITLRFFVIHSIFWFDLLKQTRELFSLRCVLLRIVALQPIQVHELPADGR